MNYLVGIHTPHHSQIQWLIMRYFSRLSYEARIDDLQGEGFCLSLIRSAVLCCDNHAKINIFNQKSK